jgi:Na+/H+ antiporter NhaD/arsenite permease-like protein
MDFQVTLALTIFVTSFIGIIFEVVDKAVIALAGAILMIMLGILSPHEAIEVIDFETIFLLFGMMVIIDVMRRAGTFDWLNVKIAQLTKGKPWLIFLLFLVLTAVFSAFLDNVTTVLLMIPVTIVLTRGMGLDPKMFVVGIILFSNIGGALTLIGDPSNILIGIASGLSFNDFIINLYRPIAVVALFVLSFLGILHWKQLRPISGDLKRLFLSHLMIQKIEIQFLKTTINPKFVSKGLLVLALTLLGFALQSTLNLPIYVIALLGASVLMFMTHKEVHIHEVLKEVEWGTFVFFAGLFVMVGALEQVGFLELVAVYISQFADNFTLLLITVLWISAIISMFVDNIPFVALMIPVVMQLQSQVSGIHDPQLLWWALSLGACLGGCGTLVGASTNVVSANIARKFNTHISFVEYTRVAAPITFGMIVICSFYFYLLTI